MALLAQLDCLFGSLHFLCNILYSHSFLPLFHFLCDIHMSHPVGAAHAEADVAGVGVDAALLQDGQVSVEIVGPPALLPKLGEVPGSRFCSGNILWICFLRTS